MSDNSHILPAGELDLETSTVMAREMTPDVLYRKRCDIQNLTVRRGLEAQLYPECHTVRVRMASLSSRDISAAAPSLSMLTHLAELDLCGNAISGSGISSMKPLFGESSSLKSLKLSGNRVGIEGVKVISSALACGCGLQHLDLSSNALNDEEAELLGYALTCNFRLKGLVLSYNHFTCKSGDQFASALFCNDSLELLDLSWNHLGWQGARAIAASLKGNTGLLNLALAMNGLGDLGAGSICQALTENKTLLELNISSNRVSDAGVMLICDVVKVNTTLQVLRLGRNQISPDVALELLTSIHCSADSEINNLDLQDTPVTRAFAAAYLKMLVTRPDFTVDHGGYLRYRKDVTMAGLRKSPSLDNDPFHMLVMWLKRKQYRLVDLYARFDVRKTWSVSKKEFISGLQKVGIDLTMAQMRALVKQLDKDVHGGIDYAKLMKRYQVHMRLLRQIQNEEAKAKLQDKLNRPSTSKRLSTSNLPETSAEEKSAMAKYEKTHVRTSIVTYDPASVRHLGYKPYQPPPTCTNLLL